MARFIGLGVAGWDWCGVVFWIALLSLGRAGVVAMPCWCLLCNGRALDRVTKQKYRPYRQQQCPKIVFSAPPHNFWTCFEHFLDICRTFCRHSVFLGCPTICLLQCLLLPVFCHHAFSTLYLLSSITLLCDDHAIVQCAVHHNSMLVMIHRDGVLSGWFLILITMQRPMIMIGHFPFILVLMFRWLLFALSLLFPSGPDCHWLFMNACHLYIVLSFVLAPLFVGIALGQTSLFWLLLWMLSWLCASLVDALLIMCFSCGCSLDDVGFCCQFLQSSFVVSVLSLIFVVNSCRAPLWWYLFYIWSVLAWF